MSGLPAGALDALLSPEGGTEAFDKVIAESQAATQAALKPVVATNSYNEKQSQVERDTIREGWILKGLRENPGKSREEIARAFDDEVRAARGIVIADEKPPVIEDGMFSHMRDAPIEDVRALAGTMRPELPGQYVEMWDDGLEREFLVFAANNNLPSQTMQRVVDWYAETSIVSPDLSIEDAIEKFHQEFASKLSRPVREKLIEFFVTDVLGDGDAPSE